jgi:hypothetical protein
MGEGRRGRQGKKRSRQIRVVNESRVVNKSYTKKECERGGEDVEDEDDERERQDDERGGVDGEEM